MIFWYCSSSNRGALRVYTNEIKYFAGEEKEENELLVPQ